MINHLTPIIEENLDDTFHQVGHDEEYFLTPFSVGADFAKFEPYRSFQLNYKKARFTFESWMDMKEMEHGEIDAEQFGNELAASVERIVQNRLEYWREVEMQEGTLEMEYEDMVSIAKRLDKERVA